MVLPPAGKFFPVIRGEQTFDLHRGRSGVTPFRGFVREATRRKLDTKITVLYSVRTTNDIIFNDEFHQLEMDNPNFKFYVTCTRLSELIPGTDAAGASRLNGSRSISRLGQHGFLRVRPERTGGVHGTHRAQRSRSAKATNEDGEMGIARMPGEHRHPTSSDGSVALRDHKFSIHVETHGSI